MTRRASGDRACSSCTALASGLPRGGSCAPRASSRGSPRSRSSAAARADPDAGEHPQPPPLALKPFERERLRVVARDRMGSRRGWRRLAARASARPSAAKAKPPTVATFAASRSPFERASVRFVASCVLMAMPPEERASATLVPEAQAPGSAGLHVEWFNQLRTLRGALANARSHRYGKCATRGSSACRHLACSERGAMTSISASLVERVWAGAHTASWFPGWALFQLAAVVLGGLLVLRQGGHRLVAPYGLGVLLAVVGAVALGSGGEWAAWVSGPRSGPRARARDRRFRSALRAPRGSRRRRAGASRLGRASSRCARSVNRDHDRRRARGLLLRRLRLRPSDERALGAPLSDDDAGVPCAARCGPRPGERLADAPRPPDPALRGVPSASSFSR